MKDQNLIIEQIASLSESDQELVFRYVEFLKRKGATKTSRMDPNSSFNQTDAFF